MIQYDQAELEMLRNDILLFFEYKYDIPKTPELDNEAFYDFYYRKERYLHAYGGRGSGKSREMIGKYVTVLLSCLPFCRFVGVRQVYNTIKGSIYQEIVDYIYEWELEKFFKILKSPMKITHIETGNYITFAGLDKPDSFKSIKDPTHVIFEECFQIKDEEAVNKVDKSVRTPRLLYDTHKLLFIYNPDNMDHWLYEHNHDPDTAEKYKLKRDNSFIKKLTYKDNKFLPQTIIDLYEADKEINPERYKVDVLGEWGRLTIEGLFYHQWDYGKSVINGLKKKVYNRIKPLLITLDFNVEPYVSLIVNQINVDEDLRELQICGIDEICLTDTNRIGKVIETMKEFLKRYRGHLGDIVVYGDRSGHSKKTTGKTDFATVFAMLKPTPRSKWITGKTSDGRLIEIDPYPEYTELECKFKLVDGTTKSSNPPLLARKILFAQIHSGRQQILPLGRKYGTIGAGGNKRPLSAKYGGYKVVQLVDQDNCRYLIKDYNEVQEDPTDGTKLNRPKELTHASDAEDYLYAKILDAELTQIIMELKM